MFQTFDLRSLYHQLGLTADASEEQLRAAYLQLVQKYTPDRHPERFNEIHRAYHLLTHRREHAETLVSAAPQPPPDMNALVDGAEKNPPRLTPGQLLSLGNIKS